MKSTLRILAFTLSGLMVQPGLADTTVTVGATASNRDAAIERAIGDALVDALGSHVFSVTTMTDDQFSTMSTSVTAGRVIDYKVLDEYETFDGVYVRVAVNLTDQDLEGIAPREVDTWHQKIEDTKSLDVAQRSVGEYRRVLDEFLIGPRHQLNSGYAFVLRGYDVEAVDTGAVKGNIYVDVILNQSWWNTYYQLVGALTPQGSQTVPEEPVKVANDVAKPNAPVSTRVDKSLQYELAHPLPVRLTVGSNQSTFILYKNALLVSAQPMTDETAKTDHQKGQADNGEISLTRGNIRPDSAKVDLAKSTLDCGTVSVGDSAVYCGNQFTVKIPFEAQNESAIIDMMKRGLKVDLDLYGSR
mgnify:CR=1 FL=1